MTAWRPSLLPGRLPLGYSLRVTGRGTALHADRRLLGYVCDAFALAEGTPCSLRRIAFVLWQDGFRTRLGLPYSAGRLRKVLSDPFYAGRVRRDGALVPAGHRGIVKLAAFEAVQRKLNADGDARGA